MVKELKTMTFLHNLSPHPTESMYNLYRANKILPPDLASWCVTENTSYFFTGIPKELLDDEPHMHETWDPSTIQAKLAIDSEEPIFCYAIDKVHNFPVTDETIFFVTKVPLIVNVLDTRAVAMPIIDKNSNCISYEEAHWIRIARPQYLKSNHLPDKYNKDGSECWVLAALRIPRVHGMHPSDERGPLDAYTAPYRDYYAKPYKLRWSKEQQAASPSSPLFSEQCTLARPIAAAPSRQLCR